MRAKETRFLHKMMTVRHPAGEAGALSRDEALPPGTGHERYFPRKDVDGASSSWECQCRREEHTPGGVNLNRVGRG